MKLKTNCYKCKYRKEVPGSAHSQCSKPDSTMEGNITGIKRGWFYYPSNFDPVWRTKECNNFETK